MAQASKDDRVTGSGSNAERADCIDVRVARIMMIYRIGAPSACALRPEAMPAMQQDDVDRSWPSLAEEARAVIAEYESALADAGFVIVPRELTREMARVGALYCNGAIAARLMWEDMIEAAPSL